MICHINPICRDTPTTIAIEQYLRAVFDGIVCAIRTVSLTVKYFNYTIINRCIESSCKSRTVIIGNKSGIFNIYFIIGISIIPL